MSKDPHQLGKSAELRHRAEKHLKNLTPDAEDQQATAQTQRLLHELQVHQIELEMQNQELRESRAQIEALLERYTSLYDFAPVGYFTLARDGAIRDVNLPGARLLGLDRSHVKGGHFGSFISVGTRPVYETWLKNVFATQTKQVCELSLTRSGQSPLVVEVKATLSPDGQEGRAVMSDITARKALEEQLRQAQKMEVVGQLAGGVAHDFNNILAAMILRLDILQLQPQPSAEAQTSLHDLEALAKRASHLTRQLLLFSRRQAMLPQRLEINATVSNLLKMLERVLGESITCRWIPSSQELWLEADPAMLDQVVMNLSLNARDAMPNGGTLTLEASLAEFDAQSVPSSPEVRPGKFVCLRISDTGCGMNADVLKHLFEPFFTTKEVGRGTGLGLASAYGIAQEHKGWIHVESVVGRGTCFRLYLPLLEQPEVKPAAPPPTLPSKGGNETILLVEDEAALRLITSRALAMFNYQVLTATNGREALELWDQHRDEIDLVLTDLRMPQGLSGLELAENLSNSKPSLKIIIMSGYSLEIAQLSQAGSENYRFLAKPFDLKTLSETIRHCLDSR